MPELDETEKQRVAPYVSNLDRDVFAVFGLPEEVIAVLFAFYSRSREDLRKNLSKLLADDELEVGGASGGGPLPGLRLASDKARKFHEKWVVGYGHQSVAEHAVVHLALENVSIVASKVIEDMRLGSYTEKSTRYVVFDTHSFVDLPDLAPDLRAVYRENGERLFRTYLELMPEVDRKVRTRVPRRENQTERAYDAAVRATTCDLLRGLLPAGTRTNIGLTANARSFEGLVTKMLSSTLPELRGLGEQMLREGSTVAPTLLKYAAANPYRQTAAERVRAALAATGLDRAGRGANAAVPPVAASSTAAPPAGGATVSGASSMAASPAGEAAVSGARLLFWDEEALSNIVLALCCDGARDRPDASSLAADLRNAPTDALVRVIAAALDQRGKFDAPPRAFEAATLGFEITCDYGAYRDLQRHRMLSPFTDRLDCRLGAEVPTEIDEMGLGDRFRLALDQARDAFTVLAHTEPDAAQYTVPLAYRIRTLWTMNVRELFHVVELRSARQGHPSYRRLAQQLYRAACEVYPWLASQIRVDLGDYPLTRPA